MKQADLDQAKADIILRTLDALFLADPELVEDVVAGWLDSLQQGEAVGAQAEVDVLGAEVIDER